MNDLIRQCEGKNIREILDAEFISEIESSTPVVFTDAQVVAETKEPTVLEETEELRLAREAKEALGTLGAEETTPETVDFDTMTKAQIAEYALATYKIELDQSMTKPNMIADLATRNVPPITE